MRRLIWRQKRAISRQSASSAWRPQRWSWLQERYQEIPMRSSDLSQVCRPAGVAASILCLALAGCREIPRKVEASSRDAATAVKTVAATQAEWPNVNDAVGTVRARTSAVIASKLMGYVRDVKFHLGDSVGAGQLLVVLD